MSEAAAPRRCTYVNPLKGPCKGTRLKAGDFCFLHDPSKESERAAARKKGGQSRQKKLDGALEGAILDAKKWKLVSYDDVREALEETVHDVRRGALSESRANAIAGLCRVILAAKNDGKLDEKLKDLESRTRVLKNVTPEMLLELVRTQAAAKANGAPSGH